MADHHDETLEQLRRLLSHAHDQRQQATQSILSRLCLRFQPLLGEVLVFCGLFISGMSVAGDWV
jgi:hypothetical protein